MTGDQAVEHPDIGESRGADPIYSASDPSNVTPAVKFCGISHKSDIEAINEIMPEFVGFVFWPKSRRYVTAKEGVELRELLDPRIRSVGVFVDEEADVVASLLRSGTISIAQLHGSENDEYIRRLRDLSEDDDGIRIWKAFEIRNAEDMEVANSSEADLVLLDGGKGEGHSFPWDLIPMIERPYALAGGLTPYSIGEALCSEPLSDFPPAIVDVSSAIETSVESAPSTAEIQAGGLQTEAMRTENLRCDVMQTGDLSRSEDSLRPSSSQHQNAKRSRPRKDESLMRMFAANVRNAMRID